MTDPERADRIIDEVCQRLRNLAMNRSFRFVRTARRDAENYLRLQTAFDGYTETEVADAEKGLKATFPLVFRAYLKRMGKRHGDLFCGSDVALANLGRFKKKAQALMRESRLSEPLPPGAVVFLFHQGYTFCYFLAAHHFDSAIWSYVEGETRSEQRCPSFEDFLRAEVAMVEEVNRQARDQGGYFLEISSSGSVARHYPALSSGERPVDKADEYSD